MMNVMKSLLAATCFVSLAATGCVRQDAAPSDIDKALPTSDQVKIKLPDGQNRTIGDLATYYLTTRSATATFNGGSAWVLVLLHSIVQYPVTSVSGVIGVLTALYWRDARGGVGQVVDVSMYESLLPLVAPTIAGLAPRSTPSVRSVFAAADGRSVAISATTEPQMQRLRALVGADDVSEWVRSQTAMRAVEALNDARVPAVEVNDVPELLADGHVVARDSITTVDGTAIPSPTPRLSATPGVVAHLGPGLGDHTAEVVAEWLHGGTT